MSRTSLLFCALLITALSLANCALWTPDDFPNPQTDPRRCGRGAVAKSWVCDPDGLLPQRSANIIEGTLKSIAAATEPYAEASDCGGGRRANPGYQVAVALAEEMDVPAGQGAGAAAEAIAARLMDAWGVGEAGCNDGTVLLLTKQPRQVAIFAGAGVKDRLDAKRIGTITEAMRPALRAGKLDEAVEGAVVDVGIALAGGPGDRGSVWGFLAALLFFGLFLSVLVTSCLQSHRRNRQVRACQGLLEKLKWEQALARAQQRYPALSCPVCLEDFQPPLHPQPQQQQGGEAPLKPPPAGEDAAPSAPPLPGTEQGRREGEAARPTDAELRASLLGPAAKRVAASSSAARGAQQDGCTGEPGCQPLVLPCGHSFCEGCLGRWLKENNTCPMCRKPLTGDPPARQPPPPEHRSRGGLWNADSVEAELLFRLNSLQRLSYIITADILAAWTHQVRSGAVIDWPQVRAEQLGGQAREQYAASGAFGASADFGGGGSSGGAGASGSW